MNINYSVTKYSSDSVFDFSIINYNYILHIFKIGAYFDSLSESADYLIVESDIT